MCTRIFKSYKIGKSALSTIVLERYNELAIRILQAPTIIMSLRSSSPNSAIITRNWANCSHLSRICHVSQQTLPIPTQTSRAKSSLDQSRAAVLRGLAIALITSILNVYRLMRKDLLLLKTRFKFFEKANCDINKFNPLFRIACRLHNLLCGLYAGSAWIMENLIQVYNEEYWCHMHGNTLLKQEEAFCIS